ncbi:isoprenylcysteine carboxylmethyltransferase family protein [Dyella sp. ASV21]|uniref:methyltransferase family protein n=1 Tax=Dyella sp. ASV21 TaxID=2795114 RepID=UPI0031B89C8A
MAVMLTGFCIRRAGMWTLRKSFSANVAVQSDHRLVIAGPYRCVRPPGYFGGWLGFVGLGLALGNGAAPAPLIPGNKWAGPAHRDWREWIPYPPVTLDGSPLFARRSRQLSV